VAVELVRSRRDPDEARVPRPNRHRRWHQQRVRRDGPRVQAVQDRRRVNRIQLRAYRVPRPGHRRPRGGPVDGQRRKGTVGDAGRGPQHTKEPQQGQSGEPQLGNVDTDQEVQIFRCPWRLDRPVAKALVYEFKPYLERVVPGRVVPGQPRCQAKV